jgi:uncharacterized membrane protein YhaH (DUF805 family)
MRVVKFLFSFSGRFGRGQYWLCQLLSLLIPFGLIVLMGILVAALGFRGGEASAAEDPIIFVTVVAYFWILLASHAKRWHDLGRSGWWQLVGLIPFGGIYVLVMCGCVRGDTGPNYYGPDPLADRDIREYSDLINRNPGNAAVRIARGTTLALAGRYDRAMEDFNAAIELSPKDDFEAFNGRAYVHFRLGDLASALADYDRAIALNPENAEALFGRGAVKLRMANKDGEGDIAAAKAIDPKIAERMAFLSISV